MNDTACVVAGVSLKLLCLVAVLAQYSPARVCALERVLLGSSCHDEGIVPHHGADEQFCGTDSDRGESHCVCELPKPPGSQQHASGRVMIDWTHPCIGPASMVEPAGGVGAIAFLPDPDPQRSPGASVSLPLLT